MISSIVSRLVILVFGTLYPAYASYKAVRTKNVKEYVKWMMYWIVFALFTCAETFTDVFLSFWFPFYYEIKIILVLWLLSPATKGSSILYRKFVHPMLSRREQEIDEYIAKAKEQGYHTVLHLGTKGVNYATTVLMQTAIKGGGGLVNQLRRSYSLSDLSSDKESEMTRSKNVPDEDDMEETDGLDPRMLRPRGYSPRRSASGSGRVEMYFPEVDVDVRQHSTSRPREPSIPLSHIRSSEDVSSGYSSAEPLYAGHHTTKSEGLAASREPLVRTASVGSTRSMRTKSSRGGVVTKRGPAAEDSDFFELQSDEAVHINREDFFNAKYPSSSPPSIPNNVTSTQEQFIDASEEELPLFDAETETQSNDFSLSESMMHDVSIETPSSKDLTISASESTTVPHPFTLSSEASDFSTSETVLQPKLTQRDADDNVMCNQTSLTKNTSDVKPDNLKCVDTYTEVGQLNSANNIQSAQPIHTVSSQAKTSIEPPLTEKQVPTVLSSAIEATLSEKQTPTALSSVVEPSMAEKQTSTTLSSAIEQSFSEKQAPTALSSVVEPSLAEKQTPTTLSSTIEQSFSGKQAPTALSSVVEPSLAEKQISTTLSSAIEQSFSEKQAPTTLSSTVEPSLAEKQTSTTMSSFIEPPFSEKQAPTTLSSVIELSLTENQNTTILLQPKEQPLAEIEVVVIKSPPAEAPSLGKTKHEESTSAEDSSLTESGVDESPSAFSPQPEGNKAEKEIPLTDGIGDESISETHLAEATSPLTVSSVEPLSPDSTVSENLQINASESEAGKLNESGSAYESSESLALPETLSRSNSQTSLRKEGRAGRYHKHPAPTPPPRTPEPEDIQSVTPTLDKKDISEDTATGSDDSEAAITTARLVLKPGVVRSLGPDSNTKTEVFVSKTPQSKSKKSKSKQKQGDSSLSRLFAIPKNQFGSLTSLLPFWHGKQEPSPSSFSSAQGSSNNQSEQLKAPLADCE